MCAVDPSGTTPGNSSGHSGRQLCYRASEHASRARRGEDRIDQCAEQERAYPLGGTPWPPSAAAQKPVRQREERPDQTRSAGTPTTARSATSATASAGIRRVVTRATPKKTSSTPSPIHRSTSSCRGPARRGRTRAPRSRGRTTRSPQRCVTGRARSRRASRAVRGRQAGSPRTCSRASWRSQARRRRPRRLSASAAETSASQRIERLTRERRALANRGDRGNHRRTEARADARKQRDENPRRERDDRSSAARTRGPCSGA